MNRYITFTLRCALLGALAFNAAAQGSDNLLRIVVPYPAGGSSDRATRVMAEALQARLNQPVVVENVVGAGGRLAMRQLAGGPANSTTLVVANPALMVVAPLVYKNNGYEPERDFQPLAQISIYEFAAAVGAAVPAKNLAELLAWVKANPDKASFGVPATGSLPHFFALMLAQRVGAKAEVVGYKGSAPLTTDLIGGHVPVAIDTLDTLVQLHEGGKLRIVASSGPVRSAPEIPTFKESGVDIVATGWNVVYARAGMPAAVADKLAADITAVMQLPEVRQKFIAAKADPVSATRTQTRAMLDGFKAQWVPVINKAGLQFE